MPCVKRPYPSLYHAGKALAAITRSADPRRRECGVHPCSQHHAWHLTSVHGADRSRWTAMALAGIAGPALRNRQGTTGKVHALPSASARD